MKFNTKINYTLYRDFPIGPVGGGPGYQAIIQHDSTFTQVNTVTELRQALTNSSIQKVFIPGHLSFELETPIEIITDGLLLASDRNHFAEDGSILPGAQIKLAHTGADDSKSLIVVNAQNVRISGLRLTGDGPTAEGTGVHIRPKEGVDSLGMEVDNCELSHFGYAAIRVDGVTDDATIGTNARVHHNSIHNNNRSGLGYGIVINYKNVAADIVYNYFDQNRHSVAGNGRENETYTAAYNLSQENSENSVEYDMHGYSDFNKNDCQKLKECDPYTSCNIAGAKVILLNNALVRSTYFFQPRGIPTDGAYVTDNFYNATNRYKLWRGVTLTECECPRPICKNGIDLENSIILPEDQWPQFNMHVWDNNVNPRGRYIWYISWSGASKWQPLFFNAYEGGKLAFGDFTGNGKTDIFYGNGKIWQVSRNGVTPWEKLNTSSYQTDKLAFGDFNGNGKTDVFLADGSEWKVSWGGTSKWERLNTSGYKTGQLAFGDFNGDGKTDVFLADGSEWKVSWGGTSKWERLNTSGYKTDQLAFGDFNGNGKTDVFLADGSEWRVSWGGTSKWEQLNTSGYKTNQLMFGNFNGNGQTDIIRAKAF